MVAGRRSMVFGFLGRSQALEKYSLKSLVKAEHPAERKTPGPSHARLWGKGLVQQRALERSEMVVRMRAGYDPPKEDTVFPQTIRREGSYRLL